MRKKELEGKVVHQETLMIERGTVVRYNDAVSNNFPIFNKPDAAMEVGFKNLPLPQGAIGGLGNIRAVIESLNLKPKQVLHSKEDVIVYEPVCVGDTVTVSTKVSQIEEQQVGGNPIGFLGVQIILTNKKDVVLAQSTRTYAVRGGFPRR